MQTAISFQMRGGILSLTNIEIFNLLILEMHIGINVVFTLKIIFTGHFFHITRSIYRSNIFQTLRTRKGLMIRIESLSVISSSTFYV